MHAFGRLSKITGVYISPTAHQDVQTCESNADTWTLVVSHPLNYA